MLHTAAEGGLILVSGRATFVRRGEGEQTAPGVSSDAVREEVWAEARSLNAKKTFV